MTVPLVIAWIFRLEWSALAKFMFGDSVKQICSAGAPYQATQFELPPSEAFDLTIPTPTKPSIVQMCIQVKTFVPK